ncbi:hypothetical protein PTI98_011614 [Pleurotus ostreatus]|nr:hypothetical protein PTI98_011614 [Pleurotus ostreatus]
MRFTQDQRNFLSHFVDSFKATTPSTKGRSDWQHAVYDAWQENWPLSPDVKASMRVYFRYTPGTTEKSQKKELKKTKRAVSTGKSMCTRSATVSARKSSRKGRAVAKAGDHFASTQPESLPPAPNQSGARDSAEGDENAVPHNEARTGMITVHKKVPQPASSERARGRSVLVPKYVTKSSNCPAILTGIVMHPRAFESIQKDTLRLDLVLPGLHAHEVEVFLSNGHLCVVAENAIVGVDDQPVITARRVVRLEYRTRLAKGIQAEDIRAWMRNGVLTLTCPTEDKTPREIEILLPQRN